jgi:hypothetical protein
MDDMDYKIEIMEIFTNRFFNIPLFVFIRAALENMDTQGLKALYEALRGVE